MSAPVDLLRWARTRFQPARFLPQALLVALAAGPAPGALAATTGSALLVLLALRLAKDLRDRERDRRESPDRVLARAAPLPFALALAASVAASFAVVDARAALAAVYAVAIVGHARPRIGLSKYGLLVLALAAAWDSATLLLAAAVFLTYVIHEVLHDRRASDRTLLAEAALLAALPLAWGAPLVAALVALGLAPLLLAHRARRAPGAWCEAVFVLGALEVLACRP